MLGDFARLLNANDIEITDSKVRPEQLHDLMVLIEEGTVSNTGAKSVFEVMFASGKPPRQVVEEEGLSQMSGAGELAAVVEKVLAANEKAVADYRSGKEEAVKFLVGQVMRETRGRADPNLVPDLLRQALAE
jgi:aspartyl-tRNA(Asn)/glutamyl-tRNA(Gln) amidotransferase subunit B